MAFREAGLPVSAACRSCGRQGARRCHDLKMKQATACSASSGPHIVSVERDAMADGHGCGEMPISRVVACLPPPRKCRLREHGATQSCVQPRSFICAGLEQPFARIRNICVDIGRNARVQYGLCFTSAMLSLYVTRRGSLMLSPLSACLSFRHH